MKYISRQQATSSTNSPVCTAIEYPLGDADINAAVIKLTGRYPDTGWVVNEKCKEMAYVLAGSGIVCVEGKVCKLNTGDVVLIEAGEKYYWEGTLELFMPCTPAWFPEQHKQVA